MAKQCQEKNVEKYFIDRSFDQALLIILITNVGSTTLLT